MKPLRVIPLAVDIRATPAAFRTALELLGAVWGGEALAEWPTFIPEVLCVAA